MKDVRVNERTRSVDFKASGLRIRGSVPIREINPTGAFTEYFIHCEVLGLLVAQDMLKRYASGRIPARTCGMSQSSNHGREMDRGRSPNERYSA